MTYTASASVPSGRVSPVKDDRVARVSYLEPLLLAGFSLSPDFGGDRGECVLKESPLYVGDVSAVGMRPQRPAYIGERTDPDEFRKRPAHFINPLIDD